MTAHPNAARRVSEDLMNFAVSTTEGAKRVIGRVLSQTRGAGAAEQLGLNPQYAQYHQIAAITTSTMAQEITPTA